MVITDIDEPSCPSCSKSAHKSVFIFTFKPLVYLISSLFWNVQNVNLDTRKGKKVITNAQTVQTKALRLRLIVKYHGRYPMFSFLSSLHICISVLRSLDTSANKFCGGTNKSNAAHLTKCYTKHVLSLH